MRVISRKEINKILQNSGINHIKIPKDKYDMILVGCQLGSLAEEDIVYMSLHTTTFAEAQNRMITRRRQF